jgi:glyoxylase-like metal-dependent hydrolase (beta-lactamase superfamily II)
MLSIQSFCFNPFQENTYIIYNTQGEAFLIDPGMYAPEEFAKVDAFLAEKQLKLSKIINTHTHLDHVFGVAATMKTYQIPFYFHAADQPVYEAANVFGEMYGLKFDQLPKTPDGYLKEGETIYLGEEALEVFLTPGHSPGSVCFYYAPGRWVISGDVLFQQSVGRSDLPGGDYDTLIRSIQNHLLTLPDETAVHSGHGPATTIGLEKMNNPYLR